MANLKAVTTKTRTTIELIRKFWDVTPCSLVEVYKRFGGTYCLHMLLAWLTLRSPDLYRTTQRHIPVMSVTNYKFNRQSQSTLSAWEFGITFSEYRRSGGTGVALNQQKIVNFSTEMGI
jgi:hypothetical protein